MIAINIEQRSPEWIEARCGIPTASNFDKIVTSKGEPSKQAQKYMFKLAGERVSGTCEESYQNQAMQRGAEVEGEARSFYEMINETTINSVGVCFPDHKRYACSPDGIIGADGIIEIKCPSMAVHIEYLLAGGLPSDYVQQVQGQLLVTGRSWCDFVSYYPGIKPLIVRVLPDVEFIKKLESALDSFCNELENVVKKIS